MNFISYDYLRRMFTDFFISKFNFGLDKNGIIYWGHLGLGDQISSARAIEAYINAGLNVVIPTKRKNLEFISSAYGSWSGVIVAEISDYDQDEIKEIKRLKREFNFRVLVVGHSLLRIVDRIEGDISLNEKLNYCAGLRRGRLISSKLRNSLISLDQYPVPPRPYAFIDHHPGTERELPQQILDTLISRNVAIIDNPRNVCMSRLIDLLDNAEELHLVASAPLCLALTVNAKSPTKYYYRTNGQHSLKSDSYKDWLEVDLRNDLLTKENRTLSSTFFNFIRYSLCGYVLKFSASRDGSLPDDFKI
jgi:hypothetical protein